MTRLVLEIDGEPVEIERTGSARNGWESFYVMGSTLEGRRARVALHSAPVGALDRPGAWRTAGRTAGRLYRVRPAPA